MTHTYDTRIEMVGALVPKGGVYAEIGVFQGTFSKSLHTLLAPSKLVLLDLFQGFAPSGDQDGNNVVSQDMNKSYELLSAKPEYTVLKGDSSTTLGTFDDNMFDMIYVDGDHSYEGCKKDLEMAYRKIKNGGYLMGHDYELNMNKARTRWSFGVHQAVDEFCVKYNQTLCAKGNDGCVSYAIRLTK